MTDTMRPPARTGQKATPEVHPPKPSTVAQPMKYDIQRHYVVKANHSPEPEEDHLSGPEVQIHPPHLRQKRNYTNLSLL